MGFFLWNGGSIKEKVPNMHRNLNLHRLGPSLSYLVGKNKNFKNKQKKRHNKTCKFSKEVAKYNIMKMVYTFRK